MTKVPMPYNQGEVEFSEVLQELRAAGLIDGNGHTDEDRSDWPRSLNELVHHTLQEKTASSRQDDEIIGRTIRAAVALHEKFQHLVYTDGIEMLPIGLALEVAMIWEFG